MAFLQFLHDEVYSFGPCTPHPDTFPFANPAAHLTILYETEFTYTAKTFVSNLRLN